MLKLSVAVTLLFVACGAVAADPERPFAGSCSTVVTVLTPPGVFPQELRIDSECLFTHLGHTTGVSMQRVTPTGQAGVVVTAQLDATTVYTAANGDQLSQSFIGAGTINVQSGDVAFVGTETFAGGTGRFADATGSSDLHGTASIFTNTGFFSTKGRLAY
jgi:hypothetical protein